MATTTNFGWTTPNDTDLVKNGAAAIRTLGSAIDTSMAQLKGGTTGQVLSKTSNTDMAFTWVAQDDSNAIQNALLTTTGDTIYASSASTPARLGIGSSGQCLTVVAGVPSWAASATSVLTTTGDLLYASGANTLARRAIGATGDVLTVSGGLPVWSAPSSSGGMTLLSTTTLSGSSTTLTSFSSSYKSFVIYVRNFRPATNNATLQMRFNGDANTRYTNVLASTATVSQSQNATSINVMAANNDLYDKGLAVIEIPDYANSATYKIARINSYADQDVNFNQMFNVGFYKVSSFAITSIALFPSSGNFTSGSALLYGVN